MKLRVINKKLNVLLSIGGWLFKSAPYDTILKSNNAINVFVQHSLNFLRYWRFDGIGNISNYILLVSFKR